MGGCGCKRIKKRRKIKERKLKVKETLITKEDVWQKGGGHVKGCKWTFIDNLCGCEGIHITKEEAKESGKKKERGIGVYTEFGIGVQK